MTLQCHKVIGGPNAWLSELVERKHEIEDAIDELRHLLRTLGTKS